MPAAAKKYKLCRRLGTGVFEKCQTQKFLQVESRGNQKGGSFGRKSDYGLQLIEKQKMRVLYGVRERQFGNYVEFALEHAKKGVSPATVLFRRLENRLDNIVYRLGIASTRSLARQMVSHGHITVNGKKSTIPSQQITEGDVISVREGSRGSALFKDLAIKLKSYKAPEWMKWDADKVKATVAGVPNEPEPFLNFQAVIEFYSR
jgi:small subunit ribosomal protein S4